MTPADEYTLRALAVNGGSAESLAIQQAAAWAVAEIDRLRGTASPRRAVVAAVRELPSCAFSLECRHCGCPMSAANQWRTCAVLDDGMCDPRPHPSHVYPTQQGHCHVCDVDIAHPDAVVECRGEAAVERAARTIDVSQHCAACEWEAHKPKHTKASLLHTCGKPGGANPLPALAARPAQRKVRDELAAVGADVAGTRRVELYSCGNARCAGSSWADHRPGNCGHCGRALVTVRSRQPPKVAPEAADDAEVAEAKVGRRRAGKQESRKMAHRRRGA